MIPYSMNPLGINNELSDLDILRQIRDANPTSQLPSLWLDTEDPYTEWWDSENDLGVLFGGDARLDQFAIDYGFTVPNINYRIPNRVYVLSLLDLNLSSLENIDKLKYITYLDLFNNSITSLNLIGLIKLKILLCENNKLISLNLNGLVELKQLGCNSNQLISIDLTGLTNLNILGCNNNQLTSIPTLTSKGNIIEYIFTYNNFQTSELDRLRSLGFTDESKLLPQNP